MNSDLSSIDRRVLALSVKIVSCSSPSFEESRDIDSEAVTASIAGNAALNTYAKDVMRWGISCEI